MILHEISQLIQEKISKSNIGVGLGLFGAGTLTGAAVSGGLGQEKQDKAFKAASVGNKLLRQGASKMKDGAVYVKNKFDPASPV